MRIKSCPWVLRRLPLLDGGELAVDERRHVERHLIGCPNCRERHASASDALGALHALAVTPVASSEAPSLWPELHRQIRQSRHAAPAPVWSLSWLFARTSPALGFGLAVGGVMAIGFLLGRTAPGPGQAPVAPVLTTTPAGPPWMDRSTSPTPPVATPGTVPGTTLTARAPGNPTDKDDPFRAPSIRLDYVLDHGYPLGAGARDPQRSY